MVAHFKGLPKGEDLPLERIMSNAAHLGTELPYNNNFDCLNLLKDTLMYDGHVGKRRRAGQSEGDGGARHAHGRRELRSWQTACNEHASTTSRSGA